MSSIENTWQILLKTALLGTSRQTLAIHSELAALQTYLTQLYPNGSLPSQENKEVAFLSTVSLVSQYRHIEQSGSFPALAIPPADTQTDLTEISAESTLHLKQLLADNEIQILLEEWLTLTRAQKRRAPALLIPTLFKLAEQNIAIRPLISAVVGQRGHWLAAQRPEWKRLLSLAPESDISNPAIWEEGSLPQRVEYLRLLRQNQANFGRETLQKVWKQEDAKTRLALLETLAEQLQAEDEDFLESCLDDRAKGVRELAAQLLGGLPDSAFLKRHHARLYAWCKIEKPSGILDKLRQKKPTLTINLPEVWDKNWLRDGIEEKPPQGKGKKAFWLEQALSYIPVQTWQEDSDLPAETYLELLLQSEWKNNFKEGLAQSLQRYPQTDWAALMLKKFDPLATPYLQQLSLNQLEAHIIDYLRSHLGRKVFSNKLNLDALNALSHCHHRWQATFSQEITALFQQILPKLPEDWHHRYTLSHALRQTIRHANIGDLSTLQHLLQTLADNTEHGLHVIAQNNLQLLNFRINMLQELSK